MARNNPRTDLGLLGRAPIVSRVVQRVHPCLYHAVWNRHVSEPHLSEYLGDCGKPVCCLRTMVAMEVKSYTYLWPTHCNDVSRYHACRRNCRSRPDSR